MSSEDRRPPAAGTRPRGRTAVLAAITLGTTLLFCLGLGEVVARLRGFEPLRPTIIGTRVTGGKYQAADPLLGYRHLPGRLEFMFDTGLRWSTTHLPDGLRITQPLEAYGDGTRPLGPKRPGLWIFGCSFVHGWGLDDDQTFAWRLQKRLPEYEVRNFGVGGYGTVQSLYQFREALAEGEAPAIVVLGYAGFHAERNTRLRRWRAATFLFDQFGTTAQPYARFGGDGELEFDFDPGSYWDFLPQRVSALARMIDEAYSQLEDRFVDSQAVSRRLVQQLATEVEASGARFLLVGISRQESTTDMLRFGTEQGIPSRDISVNLSDESLSIPGDGHPNATANRRFTGRILRLLDETGAVATERDASP